MRLVGGFLRISQHHFKKQFLDKRAKSKTNLDLGENTMLNIIIQELKHLSGSLNAIIIQNYCLIGIIRIVGLEKGYIVKLENMKVCCGFQKYIVVEMEQVLNFNLTAGPSINYVKGEGMRESQNFMKNAYIWLECYSGSGKVEKIVMEGACNFFVVT